MIITINQHKILSRSILFGGIITSILFGFLVGIKNANAEIANFLEIGSKGSDVIELQTYLAMNTDVQYSGKITGYFDSITKTAVQKFQTKQKIIINGTDKTKGYGRVGPITLKSLNRLISLIPVKPIQSSIAVQNINNEIPIQSQVRPGLPMKLKIPGIKVDSTVANVGVTSKGAMDMIKSLQDVAWYQVGPRPGETGSAVIGGHYDGRIGGQKSVFDNLYKISKGDEILIVDDKGITITFVVREIRRYDKTADATDVFISNDGKSHLNLIACDGAWNKITKSYSKRLVVFTDKVTDTMTEKITAKVTISNF